MMDRILVFIAVFLVAFTAAMVWLFVLYQAVPDTLIASVFACAGLECGVMGAIKNRKEAVRAEIQKIREGDNDGCPDLPREL